MRQIAEWDWKKLPKDEATHRVAADSATAAAERAQKKAMDNQDLIDEYRRTLPEKREAYDQRAAANAGVDQAMNAAARDRMKATPGGAAVAGGAEALQRLMGGGKWDLTKEGDIAEINNLLALARLLSTMPARERNQREPHDRTGVNFGRVEGRVFQEEERELARHGGNLDSTSRRANSDLVRLLSGLHGLQSEMLQTIAKHAGSTELLARGVENIKRKVEAQNRSVSLGFNKQPGH